MACSSKASVSGAGSAFTALPWRRGAGGPRAELLGAFMLCGRAAAGCPYVDIGPIKGVVEADDDAGDGANESGELAYAGLKQFSPAMQVLP